MTERWERDVDRAVRDLVGAPPMNDLVRARGRARLQAVIKSEEKGELMTTTMVRPVEPARQHKPRRTRWLAAAAAVLGLSAGGVAIVQSTGSAGPPQAAVVYDSAAQVLRTAAENFDGLAELKPGQFRYVDQRIWSMTYSTWDGTDEPPFIAREEQRSELWTPSKQRETWMSRYSTTSKWQRVSGDETYARKHGWSPPSPYSEDERAKCGDFPSGDGDDPVKPCSNTIASWVVNRENGLNPWLKQSWVDSRPRDPQALLRDIRDDIERYGERAADDEAVFSVVAGSMSRGALPTDLQAALYRVAALLPDVKITENDANLDGRKGTALGMDLGDRQFNMIIDPRTGEYIGSRQVVLDPTKWEGLPRGTVLDYTAVTMGVVDKLGERP